MSVERVGDVTCETVHYAGGAVRHFPIRGGAYWAMYDAEPCWGMYDAQPESQYVTVIGSARGVLVDEPDADTGGRVFSTRDAAEAAQAALPDNAVGKGLVIGRVRWHGGSVFTRA